MRTCLAGLLLGLGLTGACGGDDDDTKPVVDSGVMLDAGKTTDDAGTPDCYQNPTTHVELLNACTSAEKVTKNPTLPLLPANGVLPPLP